jgi:hypothetical protein
MKVVYRINDNVTLEQECPTVKTAFKFLAYAQEVFGPRECPESGATDHRLKFRVAQTKDGKKCEYYSLEDIKTGWEFKFGQKQDEGQTLFPKGWEPPFQREEKPQTNGRPQHRREEDEYETVGAGAEIEF